jgi:hypothetical protein
MATLNVGAMAARLGLDPSEFLDKMKGVQGFNGFVSGEMARQWKRAGRDGQEGMRLIDEALGIHVARPVARIVAETFPAFSKALSSILPGVAFTALGVAIFEFASGINRKMEEAKKIQMEYSAAVEHTADVVRDLGSKHERTMKEIELKTAVAHGVPGAKEREIEFKIDSAAADEVKKEIHEISEALEKEAKAASKAHAWTAEFFAAADYVVSNFWSDSAARADEADAKFGKFRQTLDEIMAVHARDPLAGLRESLKKTDDELSTTGADIAKKMVAMQLAQDTIVLLPGPHGSQIKAHGDAGINTDLLDKEKTYYENLKRESQALAQAIEEAMGKRGNEKDDAAKNHAKELRTELDAIQRMVATSQALAAAEELAASATAKGTAESVRAAAAAESQKKISDFVAEADTKYFSNTNDKIAATKKFQDALSAAIPLIEQAALAEQTSRAVGDFSKGVAEFNLRAKERLTTLDEEAAGHGKVAEAQAKELAGLIPLAAKLEGLKQLYAEMRSGPGTSGGAAKPAIGPPTVDQDLAARIASATSEYDAAKANVEKNINPKIQTAAFESELKRIKGELAALAGADISPWAKIDAEVKKLTADAKLLPDQIAQIRQGLVAMQNAKIGGEMDRLVTQIREAQTLSAGVAAASPFAKIDADVVKLTREFGLNVDEQKLVRQGLIELQAIGNIDKAWQGADALNAGGAKMQELRQQMDALRRASSTGKTDDGVALSSDALAAVRLEMQQIQDEEDKILLKTGGIDSGFRAWLDSLQQVESEGQFVFSMLSQASKGFEDTAAGSLVKILESHHNQHTKLIHELRQMWESYFAGLTKMALEHGMAKLLQPLAKATGIGAKLGGTVTAATPQAANTTALSANTQALIALTAKLTAAAATGGTSALQGLGNSGGGAAAAAGSNAMGTDDWAGGPSWVGERGPELLNLPRGSQVVPNDVAMRGGGDTHNHFDMRGAVVTDDLMRRAELAPALEVTENRAFARAVSATKEISLRSRSRQD